MHQELIASDVSPRVSKSDCQADFSSTSLINLILAMPEFWELLFRHSRDNIYDELLLFFPKPSSHYYNSSLIKYVVVVVAIGSKRKDICMSSPLLEPTEIIFVYRNGLLNRLSMLLSSSLLLSTLSLLVEAKGKIFCCCCCPRCCCCCC